MINIYIRLFPKKYKIYYLKIYSTTNIFFILLFNRLIQTNNLSIIPIIFRILT